MSSWYQMSFLLSIYTLFNKTKCKTMLISRKGTKSCQPPSLLFDSIILEQVSNYKYLGITITSDLSRSPHISHICNKARRLVGLLYRNFYRNFDSAQIILILCQAPPRVLFTCMDSFTQGQRWYYWSCTEVCPACLHKVLGVELWWCPQCHINFTFPSEMDNCLPLPPL